LEGTVESFDVDQGWGYVVAADGTRYFFHCTAVADGSRTIEPATPVSFDIQPGHRGQWEARQITPA
jgi:cold shock CspA family protein